MKAKALIVIVNEDCSDAQVTRSLALQHGIISVSTSFSDFEHWHALSRITGRTEEELKDKDVLIAELSYEELWRVFPQCESRILTA